MQRISRFVNNEDDSIQPKKHCLEILAFVLLFLDLQIYFIGIRFFSLQICSIFDAVDMI